MLVLSRKVGERIQIGSEIEVAVLRIRGGRVKLGVVGSPEVPIHRDEVVRSDRSAQTSHDSDPSSELPGCRQGP
jgi:carbon storage regulator